MLNIFFVNIEVQIKAHIAQKDGYNYGNSKNVAASLSLRLSHWLTSENDEGTLGSLSLGIRVFLQIRIAFSGSLIKFLIWIVFLDHHQTIIGELGTEGSPLSQFTGRGGYPLRQEFELKNKLQN